MRKLMAIGGVVLMGLAAAPAAAEPRWFEPVALSQPDAGSVRVAGTSRGGQVVAWLRSYDDRTVVQAVTRRPGEAFSAPVDVSVPARDYFAPVAGSTAFATGKPDVAMNAAGDAIVTWDRFNGTDTIVQAAVRPRSGRFSAPVDVSAPGGNATGSRAGIDEAGNSVVLWMRTGDQGTIVQAATSSANGAFSVPVDLSAPGRDALFPELAVNASGESLAVWTRRADGEHPVVQATSRPAGGAFSEPVSLSPADRFALFPRVALAPTGEAIVLWGEVSTFDDETPVARAATRGPGASFSAPVDLTPPNAATGGVDVAMDAAGNATAVWASQAATSSAVVVQAASRPAGGSFAPAVDLATDRTADVPRIALSASGDALAAWQERGLVRAAARPAGGSFGAPRDLTDVRERAGAPQVALDDADRAIAVFPRGEGPTVIQAALFDEDPPPVPGVDGLRITPARFRALRSGAAVRPGSARGGAKVSYTLAAEALVRFTVRRGQRAVGSFTRRRRAGRDRFTFTGRVGGRALRPGRYRLQVGPDGGPTASSAFTIIR